MRTCICAWFFQTLSTKTEQLNTLKNSMTTDPPSTGAEALISCDKANVASAGVIKNCGGILKKEMYSETFDETLHMYAIKR